MYKNNIIKGAIILTIAGIITRILGFVYRIYMSNIIGAEGMGLYQLIIPIYGLGWSIACSGFTTTLSKLTAEEKAKGEHGNIRLVLKQSTIISTIIGISLTLTLYFGAEFISTFLFKDERTILALKILAFSFPFMAAGSCIRGYFFGLQETIVPAINQVLEQCVRMGVVFFLASTFIPRGLEYACAAATIAIVIEEIFSFLYAFFSYKKYKTRYSKKPPSLSKQKALNLIFVMAMPLTANRVTGSLLSTWENILIPQSLQRFGMTTSDAISTYGQITGMAMPLIFFPTAFLISLAISLVPAISEAQAVKNYKKITYTAEKAILFATVIGFGASALFVTFSKELGVIIYNEDISSMLFLLGIICPFMYVQMVLSGILNGLGYQVFIFRNSLISSVINIGFIYFLVPKQGINAFILGWFISLIVICILEIEKLRESVSLNFELLNWFVKPLLSAILSALVVKLLNNWLPTILTSDVSLLIVSATILGVTYLTLIFITGCLEKDDLQLMLKRNKNK